MAETLPGGPGSGGGRRHDLLPESSAEVQEASSQVTPITEEQENKLPLPIENISERDSGKGSEPIHSKKGIKEKKASARQHDETKVKNKSKRSLLPFYTTFGFGNRGSKSPDKDKKRKNKIHSKVSSNVLLEENDGIEKKDKEKEDQELLELDREQQLVIENNFNDCDLYIENRLYDDMPNADLKIDDDQIPEEFVVKKEIKSPKLSTKKNSDNKKYSLVKARIAKYQKNSQKDRCNSPEVANVCKEDAADKSNTLDSYCRNNMKKMKYSSLDKQSKYPNHVSNLSYDSLDFPGQKSISDKDISYDEKALYDELKLIYDGDEVYAVREHNTQPIFPPEEVTVNTLPHLSIDSITLISNNNMKASLNISVSGSSERISAALPDTRWKESGRFSRRSLRKSSYRKKKDSKKIKFSSGNSSNSTSPPNEMDFENKSIYLSGASINEARNTGSGNASFPEYAKVNKKKNYSSEGLTPMDCLGLDYRKVAFRGCGERGPVAKKIEQSAFRNRKEHDNSKSLGTIKKTESFKRSKVCRKGSFTYNIRPKNIKRPISGQQISDTGNSNKSQGVKLRRRDSRNSGRQGEYRLSVTIQPSTVASLTDKFNSLISQNKPAIESGRCQTEIPLGQVSVKEGKLGRICHSPRASFKRKYRTRSHKNRRISKKLIADNIETLDEIRDTEETNSTNEATDDTQTAPQKRTLVVKKIPSIGRRSPGDNKTDEEKVCDKIETALSSGKFKGETDESDAEQDESANLERAEGTQLLECTGGSSLVAISTEANTSVSSTTCQTNVPTKTEVETVVVEDENMTVTIENIENTSSHNIIPVDNCIHTNDITNQTVTKEQSSLTNSSCSSHQKSESIDSGILSDESNAILANQNIPETVEEDAVCGIIGAIDIIHAAVASTEVASNDCIDNTTETKDISTLEVTDNGLSKILFDKNIENKNCKLNDSDRNCCYLAKVIQSDLTKQNDPDGQVIVSEIKEEIDKLSSREETNVIAENVTSDKENKMYSSIIKSVVKNTVRRTKEKDSIKKEVENEMKNLNKESWLKRNHSNEQSDIVGVNLESEKCNPTLVTKEINSNFAIDVDNQKTNISSDKDIVIKETGTKPKKDRENKIYESWIFKRLREKSSERNKLKELTPVEVPIDGEAASQSAKSQHSECGSPKHAEKPIHKTVKGKDQKDDGYGLFSFKSRGRNKEKKKTKTTSDKFDAAVSRKDSTASSKTEGSMSNSPASSVRTLHSRKLSDTSVCTIDSEGVHGKAGTTKLRSSNSQRSTSSIPPPPKTPIPSPPKSARIILNIGGKSLGDDFNDKEASDEPGSTENIYENLYSPDIDKLKKNRAKLEERGIVPNPSFLWQEGNTPNLKTTSTNLGIKNTERQQPFSKITGIKSFGRPEKIRRDHSLPRIGQTTFDGGPSYSEVNQQSIDDSHTTAAYDEIGGLCAVSYDDIRMSSSCSYDDIRAPSSVGYDSLKAPSSAGGYDPVNPPAARSDSSQYDECDGAVVTAQLAVVREDQLDSISYFYDDITYNSSQSSHSYEPVNPPGVTTVETQAPAPLAITSIQELPEPEVSPRLEDYDLEGINIIYIYIFIYLYHRIK